MRPAVTCGRTNSKASTNNQFFHECGWRRSFHLCRTDGNVCSTGICLSIPTCRDCQICYSRLARVRYRPLTFIITTFANIRS